MMDYSAYNEFAGMEKWLKLDTNRYYKKWLLYYKITEKNKIICYYSDKTIEEKDYSIEIEKELLKKLKEQLEYSKKHYINDVKGLNIFFSFSPFVWFSSSIIFVDCFISGGNFLGGMFCLPFCTLILGWTIKNYFISKKYLNDYKKNLLFYENEDDINKFLNSIQEETITPIYYNLTINDIENITYEEVKELYEKSKTYKLSKNENEVK